MKSNTIDIWICQFDTQQHNLDNFYLTLSAEEKQRAKRYKFSEHKNYFIIFHGFMREILAKYLQIKPIDIEYTKGEKGKPYLSSCLNSSIQFNLSHTKDIALLAISSDGEVGVDIEHLDRKTDWKGIVKRFFTADEQQALFILPEELQQQAFYELWTRKEAYMKVLGSGLSLSPTAFSLTVPPEKPALLQHHSKKFRTDKTINFKQLKLPQTLQNCCASIASELDIQIINYYPFI